jgi:protein-S-isoprenylcysteine O-methyltransferase Ste14
MSTVYNALFPAMWLSWGAYWLISSRAVKPTLRQDSRSSRLSYIGLLVLAAFLLSAPRIPVPILSERFVPPSLGSFATGAALTAAGLLFAVWARRHIGTNWSGTVTLKKEHQLITSGPYSIVRHPIYSGILLGFVGSAIAIGEWRGILAVVIALLSFLYKLRLEERWMREHFGDAYRAYCRRVRALIPFIV